MSTFPDRRRFPWRKTAVIALAVIAVGFGWRAYRENVRLRVVAENTTKAQELKRELDARFPPGTSELEIVAFLKREHPEFITSGTTALTEYWLPVAQEPSNVWYCGSWTAGVQLVLERGRLRRTEIDRWSNDCL